MELLGYDSTCSPTAPPAKTASSNLFVVNSQTGRGNLIYHRYNGHCGLITPAGP